MKTFHIILLSILLITGTSCTKESVIANGNTITDTRALSNFTEIASSGSTPLFITYGANFKVEVRGSSNLIPYYKTEVRGNTLNIGFKRANIIDDDIRVYITLPALSTLSLSGSGNAEISGIFPQQDYLGLRISGSANIRSFGILALNNVDIDISGSGKADLSNTSCENADIRISGSGDAKIQVSNRLKARISGSGKVYYRGNPQTDVQVSGSGGIIPF